MFNWTWWVFLQRGVVNVYIYIYTLYMYTKKACEVISTNGWASQRKATWATSRRLRLQNGKIDAAATAFRFSEEPVIQLLILILSSFSAQNCDPFERLRKQEPSKGPLFGSFLDKWTINLMSVYTDAWIPCALDFPQKHHSYWFFFTQFFF